MKKFQKTTVLSGVLALVFALTLTVLATSYDSSEDPIISLSYLMDVFHPSVKEDYEAKIGELQNQITQLSAKVNQLSAESTPNESTPETDAEVTPPAVQIPDIAVMEPIELTTGDTLLANGVVHIMLRAGTASCIAPDPTQGLSDYTEGKEIYNGESLTKNHMCLIPRGDGRGIIATSESVWIMVEGEYSIVKSES